MKCMKIYHDDKDEELLRGYIEDILYRRLTLGNLTEYEIKECKSNEY